MDRRGYITQCGFIVAVDTLKRVFKSATAYDEFLRKLTIVNIPKVGPRKVMQLYSLVLVDGRQCISLPRTLIGVLTKSRVLTHIVNSIAMPDTFAVSLQCELFDEQAVIVQHLLDHVYTPQRLLDGTATCLLNLTAGGGKTFVAGAIIAALKLPTLYITTRKELATQAVRDLRLCLYDDEFAHGKYAVSAQVKVEYPMKVIRYDKVKTPDMKCGVLVIIINSAMKLTDEQCAGFGLVIFDEAHSYCTQKRYDIFRRVMAPAYLGLSATTEDRNDAFDVAVHKELAADGIIRASTLIGAQDTGPKFDILVRVIKYVGPPQYSQTLHNPKTGKMSVHLMLQQFASDPYRVQLAINEIKKLYEWRGDIIPSEDPSEASLGVQLREEHCIFVFCEEREPLLELMRALMLHLEEGAVCVPEYGIGTFMGGTTEVQSDNIKKHARIILATFSFAGTGVSIVKATAIVLYSSRRSGFKQIVARILRKTANYNIQRVIIDIINNNTALKYQFGSRLVAYEHYGAKIETCSVKWTDLSAQVKIESPVTK